jgi:hypothetical protein
MALLLPLLLAGVGPSAAASVPSDACRVPTTVESVLGTPEMCSTLDRLGDPVGVIEVSYVQRWDIIIATKWYIREFGHTSTILRLN